MTLPDPVKYFPNILYIITVYAKFIADNKSGYEFHWFMTKAVPGPVKAVLFWAKQVYHKNDRSTTCHMQESVSKFIEKGFL